jgi:MFS transporter, SP family, arabinose:H+ symporter
MMYDRVQGMAVDKRLSFAALAGSFGGFVFGFDLGAIAAATQSLKAEFMLSSWAFGLTISASIWGTVVGAILAARLVDGNGRRNLIAWCALLYGVAAAGIVMRQHTSWHLVLAMRLLCGMAIGGITVACPLYLSEVAPIAVRGRVVGLFQVQIGIGAITAFYAGSVAAHFTASCNEWRWTLGLGVIPAMILVILAQWMPRIDAAALIGRSKQRLFVRRNTRLILLATSIAIFNQLSGVNVLLLYILEILASAGVNFSLGHQYTVLISVLSLATTMIGIVLVDRVGRKPLLYLGSIGMAFCLLSLGFAVPYHRNPGLYLSIFVAYNGFFAISQGTVVWVYLSELFPPGLRGPGQGLGSTVHWITNAVLISVFPVVQHASSVSFFYIFAVMMLLQLVVIWRWYPETTGTELGTFASSDEGRLH